MKKNDTDVKLVVDWVQVAGLLSSVFRVSVLGIAAWVAFNLGVLIGCYFNDARDVADVTLMVLAFLVGGLFGRLSEKYKDTYNEQG